MSECRSSYPRLITPTSDSINRLLWGDWNEGAYGFISRSLDLYDIPHKIQKWIDRAEPHFAGFNSSFLPASFVHISQHAPNPVFNLPMRPTVAGLVVASQFSMNNPANGKVHAPVCYPLDAGSNKRRGMLSDNGRGCRRDGSTGRLGMCDNVTGICLFTPQQECACNYQQVPSETFGDFFSTWLETAPRPKKGELVGRTDLYTCWFETSHKEMREMIIASNSYWHARKQWSKYADAQYWGWTECPVTSNIKTEAEAILVQLPIRQDPGVDLCSFGRLVQNTTLKELHNVHSRGYSNLPVIFMEQSKGMFNVTECQAVWNGTQCMGGYRKEIFAQEFNFTDGSCLAIPDQCRDVYFFPADNVSGVCKVTSEECQLREAASPNQRQSVAGLATLLRQAPAVNHQNDAFASYERQASLADGKVIPLPSSFLLVMVNLLAMFCFYLTLRRRGRSIALHPSLFLPKFCIMSVALIMLPLFLIHARIGHEMTTTSARVTYNVTATNNNRQQYSVATNHVAVLPKRQVSPVANLPPKPKQAANAITPPASDITPFNGAACPAVVPPDTRILLLTIVQAFHGSTALASVLMSSPSIATYCSGKTWQCEGYAKAKMFACPGTTECLRDKRQLLPKQVQGQRREVNLFDLFGLDYNLTRPIFHDKLFPREPGYTELWEETLQRSKVAPEMAKVGIRKIIPVYMIMWTPPCLLNVQTRSLMALQGPRARKFLQHEVWNLQRMRQQHEALVKAGTPVLVISYADLLFREQHTLDRMNTFLPCAGGVNADYVPQMNVDVFPENKWKVRGTVHDFSQGLDPVQCCAYDVDQHKCLNRTYFKLIPEFEQELNELDAYFTKYST